MFTHLRHIALFALAVCCTLCVAQQQWFSVEVRRPAAVSGVEALFETSALMLVNNVCPQPDTFGHNNAVSGKQTESSEVDLSDAARQVLFGMERAFFEQELYDDLSVLDRSQSRAASFTHSSPLGKERVDSLCRLYGVPALLVLDNVIIYDKQSAWLTDDGTWFAMLEAYCTTRWKLSGTGIKDVPFTVSDTLYWSAEAADLQSALLAMPDRQDALLALAYDMGDRAASALMPRWETEDRYLYSFTDSEGNYDAGIKAFGRQRWQEAADWWIDAYESTGSPLKKAYAAADIAVAFEMAGKPKDAIRWTDKALSHLTAVRTTEARQQIVNLRYYRTRLESNPDMH